MNLAPERTCISPFSLDAANFLAADVRGALGSYLNVFLVTQQHWSQSEVGLATTPRWTARACRADGHGRYHLRMAGLSAGRAHQQRDGSLTRGMPGSAMVRKATMEPAGVVEPAEVPGVAEFSEVPSMKKRMEVTMHVEEERGSDRNSDWRVP
jgi:hypothetical protein